MQIGKRREIYLGVVMGLNYDSLDDQVRAKMLQELENDIAANRLYISPRLTDEGRNTWPDLLRDAIKHHNDDWLAEQLRTLGLIRDFEQRKTKTGARAVRVPITAPNTLAEGEFNRYYARGLCSAQIDDGHAEVEVYRAKFADNPRRESELMIGRRLPAESLLEDLRTSQGVEPALGVPPGPNSGLSVRRPIR